LPRVWLAIDLPSETVWLESTQTETGRAARNEGRKACFCDVARTRRKERRSRDLARCLRGFLSIRSDRCHSSCFDAGTRGWRFCSATFETSSSIETVAEIGFPLQRQGETELAHRQILFCLVASTPLTEYSVKRVYSRCEACEICQRSSSELEGRLFRSVESIDTVGRSWSSQSSQSAFTP